MEISVRHVRSGHVALVAVLFIFIRLQFPVPHWTIGWQHTFVCVKWFDILSLQRKPHSIRITIQIVVRIGTFRWMNGEKRHILHRNDTSHIRRQTLAGRTRRCFLFIQFAIFIGLGECIVKK